MRNNCFAYSRELHCRIGTIRKSDNGIKLNGFILKTLKLMCHNSLPYHSEGSNTSSCGLFFLFSCIVTFYELCKYSVRCWRITFWIIKKKVQYFRKLHCPHWVKYLQQTMVRCYIFILYNLQFKYDGALCARKPELQYWVRLLLLIHFYQLENFNLF